MENFDITLVRYQKMIDSINNNEKICKDSDLILDSNQKNAITATEIETGEIWIGNSGIRFERTMLLERLSIMLPLNTLACKIEEDGLEFYASEKHEFCVSVQCFSKESNKNIQLLKRQYTDMMTRSKQKTVWLKEEESQTIQGQSFHFLLAKHPMPEKDSYNLLALFELEQNVISITFSVYMEEYLLWNHIAVALLQTVKIDEIENGEDNDENTNDLDYA